MVNVSERVRSQRSNTFWDQALEVMLWHFQSTLFIRSEFLRPIFRRKGIGCCHLMGEMSKNLSSCLKLLWEDALERDP